MRLSPPFHKIEGYIEANLNEPLDVLHLARIIGMSRSHFSRTFRKSTQLTPHRYVMWRRLTRARELVEASDVRLSDIALETGFSDQSHLCRYFSQWIGISPSELRRQNR